MDAVRQVTLSERLAEIDSEISAAALKSGRQVAEITTIVVTKFQPASLIRELSALGVRNFGESRHQEARQKVDELNDPTLVWHFVGQVQGKKARHIAEYSRVIHSIDREPLLTLLASDEKLTQCFLQLNLTDDPARGGVNPDALLPLAEVALRTPGIELLGVMAVAPLGQDPSRSFARVRMASELLQTVAPDAVSISAGMSGDFREAIREGATHLRIGSAITGNRPVAG